MKRLLLAVALLAATAAPVSAAGCKNVTRSGRWSTIALPAGVNSAAVEMIPAATASRPDVLLAFTDRTLLRSGDGGCTWVTTFSLDKDAPESSLARLTTTYSVYGIAVSGGRNVYAFAVNVGASLLTSPPVVTMASSDGGVRWTFRQMAPADLAADYPRCTNSSSIHGSPDPKVAHLSCANTALGDFGLTLFGPQCRNMLYVTKDAGTTWLPVTPRYAISAVGIDEASRCGPMATGYNNVLVPDPYVPHVLWRLEPCAQKVLRSADDGKTASVYATLPSALAYCGYEVITGRVPGLGQVVVACDPVAIWVSTKPGGTFVRGTTPRLKNSEFGTIRGCSLDPRSGRLAVFYFDGAKRSRAFSYDIVRRVWQPIGFAPVVKNQPPAWDEWATVSGQWSPATRAVYAGRSYGTLLRVVVP